MRHNNTAMNHSQLIRKNKNLKKIENNKTNTRKYDLVGIGMAHVLIHARMEKYFMVKYTNSGSL